MKRDEMLHGRYIKAGEFRGKPVTLNIAALDQELMEREDGTEQSKWVVTFSEKRKTGEPLMWVLNRTNIECLFAMWDDTEDWIGKPVTLVPERDDSPINDTGLCIRVSGSPALSKTVTAKIKLGKRKRPIERRLVKTSNDGAGVDRETGEVYPDPESEIPGAVEDFTGEPGPNPLNEIGTPGDVVAVELEYKAALKKSTLPDAKKDSALKLMDANRAAAEMKGDWVGYTEWLRAQTARVPGAES